MNNISPLRYPGGKTRARAVLTEIMRAHFDPTQYSHVVSPFFGGGSFEFWLQKQFGWRIVANDAFTPLISFWNAAKHDQPALTARLREIQATATKQTIADLRRDIMTQQPFEQACAFFAINRSSFSGATLSGGISPSAVTDRFTASSIDRVSALDLDNVEFHNEGFASFLDRHWTDGAFAFLDPPYRLGSGSSLYGQAGDKHAGFDHEQLHSLLSKRSGGWMMTYNDCEWVRQRYSDCLILDVTWAYGMNASKASAEIVILPRAG